jgi:hypothetical protein
MFLFICPKFAQRQDCILLCVFHDIQWTMWDVEVTQAVETEVKQNKESRKQTEIYNASTVNNVDPQRAKIHGTLEYTGAVFI